MKRDGWGDLAYYIEYTDGEPTINATKILKHGRVYITCDYRRETRFEKMNGIEQKDWGDRKIFFQTSAEAERYIYRKNLKTDIREWFSWMSLPLIDKLTDEELRTVHDILVEAKKRKV